MSRVALLALVLLAPACGKRQNAGGPTLPALKKGEAFIVAPSPGATVAMDAADGSKVALDDGERVTFQEDDAGAGGDGSPTRARIVARGREGTVPNVVVASGDSLHASPDGTWAVFSPIESCGDFCHGSIWLLSAAGARHLVTDLGGPDTVAAWSADGKEVAIGHYGLWLVELPGAKVTPQDGLTAPSYAPDGTLYARDLETGSVMARDRTGAWTVAIAMTTQPADGEVDLDLDFGPVTFGPNGKPVTPND